MSPARSRSAVLRRRRVVRVKSVRWAAAAALVGAWLGCAGPALRPNPSTESDLSLRFRDASGEAQSLSLASLRRTCAVQEVEVDDPYHGRRMRYSALELRCVLDRGFGDQGGATALRDRGLLLRALDGYTRPASGRDLLEPGGYLAFGEPDRLSRSDAESAFSRIDRRQVDPAPFYMIWTGIEAGDPHETPWPYQLAEIAVAAFEQAFPATVPVGLEAGDPGWMGYRLFQQSCASCHSINGQGGKIGPDLNVPRSIVEYRPVDQVRAYIRNPEAFRYTSMPAHPGLNESDLDALIAYFEAMRARKQDPLGGAGRGMIRFGRARRTG